VVARERDGNAVTHAVASEEEGVPFLKRKVRKGTTVHADEAAAWNKLEAHYDLMRINHQQAYSADGACTNQAESYFSRLHRAEIGQFHRIAGPYLGRYAQEMAWKENHRRVPNGDQFRAVLALAAASGPSVDFCGYWQRSRKRAAA
jgi:hypothetical protein